jgi:acetyl/propionyl-CoA carboxylase alpha subunit
VKAYHIPLVPGTEKAIESYQEALEKGKEIGFPILIKASAGGGGKGMRVVREESEFEEALTRAQSEAKNAFGDGSVFLERYIGDSKHIEVQVLCDSHDNYLYLFERECTIQRRHQKVVEEAPSPVIDAEKRKRIGEDAVNVARSCNYLGAGTVEFIFDVHTGEYYFLEMNTRLQVEHPVTEMITGVDLVREQINIADGKPISFKQNDLKINGHSIEVRVYAEDPSNNFLPDTGRLMEYITPKGVGVRVDDGFERGMEIPVFYDPMIAKLIVHADTREAAIEKMLQAISDYHIAGIQSTLGFCRFAVDHPDFRDGSFTTKFVENYFTPTVIAKAATEEELISGAIAAALFLEEKTALPQPLSAENTNWKTNRSF